MNNINNSLVVYVAVDFLNTFTRTNAFKYKHIHRRTHTLYTKRINNSKKNMNKN